MTPEVSRDALEQVQRRLIVHEWLLRSLLTHLAMTDPDGLRGIIGGFQQSQRFSGQGEDGRLAREAAEQLLDLLKEVAG